MSRLLVNKSTAFVSGSVVLLGVLSYYAKKKARRSVTRRDLKHKRGETSYNGKNFKGQIKFLLNIVLPSWRSKEAFVLAAHTGFLFTRTFLSLYVAHLDGALVKALVSRDGVGFVDLLIRWMVVAIPSSACNSMIKYLESTLATCFRARLSEYSLKHYMDNEVYYRVLNLDDRVTNADQRLTEDVSNFCTNLAHVHSQLSKPFLDVIMSSFNLIAIGGRNDLRRGAGTASTILGCIVIYVSWATLRFARPPLGALVARQAALEGRLRHVHARLIHNAEEIGFYRGHNVELAHLTDAFEDLRDHQTTVHMMRVPYNTLESFLMKYVWSAAGIGMLAMPAFFFENVKKGDTSELMSTRTGDVVTSRKLLLTAADAIERMLLALKEVAELAGYSSRVVEALTVFDEVGQGQYVKHVTVQNDDDFDLKLDPLNTTAMSLQSNQSTEDDDDDDDQQERAVLPLFERRGVTEIADCVAFDHVPIVTPNGDLLVRDLNFSVQPGDHLLISGPNGCGKSSLFRILGGLWPVHGGKVKKPSYSDMFYIPQQPYMTLGTLREQIIYPDTLNDMRLKGRTDDQLMDILRRTHTEHVATREVDGLDAIADWKSALSGGLLQRVGMARILYHKPKYAILDECTSAVSIDVEGSIYQYMIDIGITLLTVTHRPSLWKYHKFLLQFDGEGGYFFRKMDNDANQVLSLAAERDQVHSQLKELQTRLNKLDEEMAVVDD